MSKKTLPEELLGLARTYTGDESWERFVNTMKVDERSASYIENKFKVDSTLAKALEWYFGEANVAAWLTQKVPALDYYSPLDLIRHYEEGEHCVRVTLRRMK